jgi:hypothetical protein
MNCNEHHIICKAVGDGWICAACETRYMPMSELDQLLEAQQQPKRLTDAEVDRIVNGQFTREIAYAIQREAWSSALRYARDNGYFGGLSVDDAVKVAYDWFEGPVDNGPGSDYDKLRARLTAKLQGQ